MMNLALTRTGAPEPADTQMLYDLQAFAPGAGVPSRHQERLATCLQPIAHCKSLIGLAFLIPRHLSCSEVSSATLLGERATWPIRRGEPMSWELIG